jgi:hypothetical protein
MVPRRGEGVGATVNGSGGRQRADELRRERTWRRRHVNRRSSGRSRLGGDLPDERIGLREKHLDRTRMKR